MDLSSVGPYSIAVIAFALGCDAFSVALSVGAGEHYRGQSFRLGWHFALFQMLMAIIGWGMGRIAADWVYSWHHWIASGILFVISLHTMKEALWPDHRDANTDLSRGWYLVTLSIATSIDALAVGIAFGVLEITPWAPSFVIGLFAGGMTLAGLHLGRKLRAVYGRVVEFGGSILLLLIAVKIFFEL